VTILLNAVGLEAGEAALEHARFIKELLKVLETERVEIDPSQGGAPDLMTANKHHMWNFFKINGGTMIKGYFTALL